MRDMLVLLPARERCNVLKKDSHVAYVSRNKLRLYCLRMAFFLCGAINRASP